ncbi:hypothetical protein GDO81_017962 [Engystomops pustulosus]|uniref:Hemicentin-1 n=1 Tax=Engystomops pustulosus TaxID=76066 RepID=A0AAV7ADP5_ENGPU|nr:hypothetical protein GDO81_017962 [Engystomops pustulosus]
MNTCRSLSIQLTALLLLLQLLQPNSCVETEPDQGKTPDGASTLAFVFDVTGSMYDDLVQVIEGASKILETSLSRPKKPLYNFALVPFHDPEIGPVTITTDPETFKNELKELYVQGGGDCPEMSVGAIKIALEISLPGSFIYVFTDARSKDYQLANDVLQLIQQKQSQVVFVLTGDCDDRSHVGYKIYEEIASTSSGQVFHLDKKQVNEVLKWVEEAVQASKVHLVSTDHLSGALNTWEIPFDPSLREVTVSLSGPSPNIELFDPLGMNIKQDSGLNELLNIFNSAKVLNVKEPEPGTWKIKTSSNGRHSVRITGVSTIDFRAGFSNKPTLDFSKTSSRPIQGIPTYVLLNTTGLQHPARIDQLELLSTSGLLLKTIPIKYYPDRTPYEIWNVTEFIPPKEPFFLRITGYDKDDYLFQRASSVSFSNILPGPPKVSMPKVTPGYYLQPGRIPCNVESLIPVSVHFRRNGKRLGLEQKFQDSVEAVWEITNVTSYDEGYYECFATSTAGSARAQTFLDVNEPPPVLRAPSNITINIGEDATLTCDVLSTVRYNLTWWRKTLDLRLTSTSGIQILSDNSLQITSVMIDDAGEYICSASNEGGTTAVKLYLTVQEPPRVIVDPQNITFTKGSGIKLKCFATGYPAPQIVWTHNDIFVRISTRYILTQDGTFFIKNAMERDAGVYTCLAANAAGTDRQSSVLVYIEAPIVTVTKKEILVAVNAETTMECKTTGVPKPHVHWFKGIDDFQLSTSSLISIENHFGTLTIKNTQYSDAGDYICVAANEAGKASGQVSLSVGSAPVFIEKSEDIAMDIGSDVKLLCTAQGIPEPKIKWRKLNMTSTLSKPLTYNQKTGILQINHLWVGDEGIYVCEAENHFGKVQTQVAVTLTGLVIPVIGESPHVVNVIEGNQITLPCVLLAGNPLPVRQWLKNDIVVVSNPYVSVRTDGSLHLESAHLKDGGDYVCAATNVAGTSKRLTTINVHVSPIIQHGPQIFSTIEGNPISLPCKASGVPKPTIIWKKKGETVTPNNASVIIESDGSLYLSSPGGEDSAEYSCTAVNAAGYAARKVQLTVYVKPRRVHPDITGDSKSQTEISVKVGDSVVLPCEVKSVPPPFITWAKETQLISPFSQRHNILPSGSMKIFESRVTDTGTYTCVATNIAGNITQTVKLNVHVPPKIQKGPKIIRAKLHQSFEINCASNGIPLPKTTWFKDGKILEVNDQLKDTTIRVHSAELSDAGLYTCIASNVIGQDDANVTVEIRAPPTLSNLEPPYDKTNQERISNQWVAFPCPAKGTPKPVIKWLHNNKELTGAEPGLNITKDGTLLIINSLTLYDNGEYKCVATNEAGLAEKKYNLKVHDPPGIKDKEQLTNVSVLLNRDVTLYCDATGSPPPLITWYNGTTQVVESNNVLILEKGKVMKILKTTVSGYFTCTASNLAGSSEKQFFVNVLDPPEIASDGSNVNVSVISGNEAKLECRVKGKPFPTIQWFKENRLLFAGDPNINILENGQVLYIKHAHLSDNGYYRCVASNPAGSQTKESKLTVFVPPSIKDGNTTTELSFLVDSEINVECDVRGIPHPIVTWYKDGIKILPSTRVNIIENGKFLQIFEAKATDSGTFTCHVANIAGTAEKMYLIDIYVPATIDGDLSTIQGRKVIRGNALLLECEARGHPLPMITWLKEGVPVETSYNIRLLYNGKKLEIKRTEEPDQGLYVCVATNIAGETEIKYNVQVLVSPTIEDRDIVGEYTAIANNPIELECYATGTPIPTIRWLKNGIPLQSDGQKLIILESESSDSGSYECIAENDAGSSRKLINVNVHVPPKIIDNRGTQVELTAVLGTSMNIECLVTGVPTPQINWLKNGLPLPVSPQVRLLSSGQVFRISRIQKSDEGVYTCVSSNRAGVDKKQYNLQVFVPPNMDDADKTEQLTTVKGNPTTMSCLVSGQPVPHISWLKDGKVINHGESRGFNLQILNTEMSDTGRYSCVASNEAGSASKHFILNVLEPPQINGSENTDELSVVVNHQLHLSCHTVGFPPPVITWLKDGQILSQTDSLHFMNARQILQITSAQEEHIGLYSCLVSNQAGEAKKEFAVTVHVPPSIAGISGIHNITVLQNKSVILECKSDALPPPDITWMKDGKQLMSTRGLVISPDGQYVHIENAEVTDTGRYTCIASNVAGKNTKEYKLTVYVPPSIKDGPVLVTTFKNSSATLECIATGIPLPRISWRKDGSILYENSERYFISGSGSLSFPLTDITDSGIYICLATNAAGSSQKKTELMVYDPPFIIPGPKNITVEVNKQTILNCDSRGTPKPKVEWNKNGQLLNTETNRNIYRVLPSGSLLILSPTVDDTGTYVCSTSNDAGHDKIEVSLTVLVPPSIADEVTNIFVSKSSSAVIPCTVYGVPHPTVQWLKDGIRLPTEGDGYKTLASGSIEVARADLSHAGTYTCRAVNEVGAAQIYINLHVQEVPVIQSQAEYLDAVINQSVTLACEATGTPLPTQTWQKEGVTIKTGSHYTILSNGSLKIVNVRQEDAGSYTCIAQNPAGTALGRIKLKIYESPSIKPHQKEYIATVDESVTMVCEVYGNPAPQISWHKDGSPLSGQGIISNGALQIASVQPDDAGQYMCVAENIAGSVTADIILSVLIPPQIIKNAKNQVVRQSFQVFIPCTAHGNPTPKISWKKNNISIKNTTGKYEVLTTGELVMHNAEKVDAGSYTCTAINVAGKDSHTVSLDIHYAPSFTELPLNVSLNKGEKLSLSCKTEGNPLPKISWLHEDRIIVAQPGQSKFMTDLVIERILKEEEGAYTCIAENTVSSINTTVYVFVREPPVLNGIHHVHQTVPLGGRIILNCIVEGNPVPKIQWSRKGNDILYNKRFKKFSNGSLAIYNTKNEDVGDYTCIATNDAGVLEHTITLSLQTPPIIRIHPINVTVDAGATVVLNCQAEGKPEPDIAWSRVPHPISGDNRFTILSNGSLQIVAARKEDTSIYECRATNIMGSVVVKASFTVQVHGGFSDWLPWQSCSVTCGQGVQKRIRLCDNPISANGGLQCQEEDLETRVCQNKPCPVDGSWSDWSPWEECSKTCGIGKKTRTRTCHVPPGHEGGRSCLGKAVDTIECNSKPCPVDGIWSSWEAWGACTKTCGKGTQTRIRLCNNPPPSFDGSPCEGHDSQTQICSDRHCPVDGKWSVWGSWTSCSLSCGGGLRQRFRECSNPAPQYGGHKCEGKEYENEFCNGDLCPVHGSWGPWSSWGACSRTCNGGQMRRYRACDNPAPSNSGRGCSGADTEMHKCNTNKCPSDGNWGPWEAWSKCSATCGGGQQIRTRLCKHVEESNSVRSCLGDFTQVLKCNVQACQGGAQFIRGTLSGTINDLDFGIAFLNGNITKFPDSHSIKIKAQYNNVPKSLGPSMRNLASILNPIYWTVAREIEEAINGFTLTGGEFIRESQVEFATGEVLRITHTARGLDADGFLILDTVVKGYILQLQSSTDIMLKDYTEDYVQTGLGQLYAYSTRMFYLDGVSVPYAWNHTVSYDPSHGKMPFMVEILRVSSVETDYNPLEETLDFEMHASISKGDFDNQCPLGFSYDLSGLYCEDDDECVAHNPCSHTCHNIMGSYYCSCPKGLMSSADGRTCHDIDECTLEDAVCRKNEECRNTIGSYSCILKCGVGFRPSTNALDCKDINECKESNPCHQRCLNTIGSYHCGCEAGFHLKGKRCYDLNECRQQVCRPDQMCKNTRGSYKCIDLCPSGFTKLDNGSCADINECIEAMHRCKNNQICENTHGSYACVCPRGFRSEGPGKPCVGML